MKTRLVHLIFLALFTFTLHAQEEKTPKMKRVKTTWTNNGFFHAGIRPNNWEIDQFAAAPGSSDTIYKNGIEGSCTPLYLSVEQMARFFYWNMDMSAVFRKKSFDFADVQKTGFFKPEDNTGYYQSAEAAFMGSLGYLWRGRLGFYAGGRIAYDNTLVHFTTIAQGSSYLSELGGTKKGYNFHLFFPFIRGMFRISLYNDQLSKGEFNFKAKSHETEFNYCIPFNKLKSSGLMLKWNHMEYSSTNYLPALMALTGGPEIHFKRNYFQVGIIIPVFKPLAPDACPTCSGKGRILDPGKSTICTSCNGKGGTTCGTCGGGGRIYSADGTNSNYCPGCHGSGSKFCMTCAGTGHIGHASYTACEVCKGTGKKAK